MALYALPLSPNDHPTTAQGFPEIIEGHPEIAIFQPIHANPKTGKSPQVGPQGGGGDLGEMEKHLGPLPLIGGFICKEKVK